MSKTNLANVPALTTRFFSDAQIEYERYKADREAIGYDAKMIVADAMWRCFRESDVSATEQRAATGKDESEDTVSNVGSRRFFRLVNQKNGMINAVIAQAEVPWKYLPISNPEVFRSAQEASDQAAIHNVLAKYAWKNGGGAEKMFDFGAQAGKYSNVPIMVFWNEEQRRIKMFNHESKKTEWKTVTVKAHPDFRVLAWHQVYADIYVGSIQEQNCVVVLTPVTWKTIQDGVRNKWFDAEQAKLVRENWDDLQWDASEGADFREQQATNDNADEFSPGPGQVLMWDVYQFAPIKGGEYDDEADYELYWGTAIGNSLDMGTDESKGKKTKKKGEEPKAVKCVPLRLITDFDPDGEIPIEMAHSLPDDMNLLYHMSWSEAVRSPYAVECTLWNQTVDNNGSVNEPMLAIDTLKFNVKPDDLRYKKGMVLDIQDPNSSVKEFSPRSTLGENLSLIREIREESENALNASANSSGRGIGGRASASESLLIDRWTSQPNLAEIRYLLGTTLRYLARKNQSYWQGFASDEMIKAIADEGLSHPVYVEMVKDGEKMPAKLPIYGSFDIEIGVLDEFVKDDVAMQREGDLMKAIGNTQSLMKSDTHSVDMGFWLRDYMLRSGVKQAARIVVPSGESDAHLRQREEMRVMKETGQPVTLSPGENDAAHIAEIEAEMLRFNATLGADDNLLDEAGLAQKGAVKHYIENLLIPHLQEHKTRLGQAEAALQGSQPGAPQPRTPGQAAAEPVQALLGEVQGG